MKYAMMAMGHGLRDFAKGCDEGGDWDEFISVCSHRVIARADEDGF